MKLKLQFSKLSIRLKLLYGYTVAFMLVIVFGNLILFFMIRSTIEKDIERELRNTTASILQTVRTVTKASIKNHIRAVAEKNLEMVHYFYEQYRNGSVGEAEAKAQAANVLLSQIIGTTGYIYCVDSRGVIQVHPQKDLIGQDLSKYSVIDKQRLRKQGYLDYEWANPGESNTRPKALYMVYFGPWDWIISVSSYRNEFKKLLNIDDFKKSILALTFGQTGYSYVMDSQGNLIIHPKLEGTNIYDSKDSSGRMFIKEICERKSGKIIYPWQNPGEPEPRQKLVLFNYIPDLDWIVASSSYLEEFYHPLKTLGYATMVMAAFMLIIITPLTWWINGSITRPLRTLMDAFSKGATGDTSGRIALSGGLEIRQLATFYNRFMERLEESRKRLKQSEEKYRGIFENAVEGVFQTTPEGRFISANPSMAATLGYGSPEKLLASIHDVKHQLYVNPNHREKLLQTLNEKGMIFGFETQLLRRDGSSIWVSINARAVKDDAGSFQCIEGLLSDISQRKEAETKLRQAKEELERRVQDRTAQLSNWVSDLKRRNHEGKLLREMGDMIQVCRTTEETYPVIEPYLQRLFPRDRLCLFTYNEDEKAFESVLPACQLTSNPFKKEDCWAIRQGKPYLNSGADDRLACAHFSRTPENGYLCAPLIAQGEHIGLLYIQFGSAPNSLKKDTLPEQPLRLAATIADHLALSLANLKLRETLRFQSIEDPLTGLFNRRYMEEALHRELARIKRQNSSMAVIMLDVDHFKKLNDTYGHDLGDNVLRELGRFLNNRVRTEDIPCRYGGEEFALILTDIPMDSAITKAEDICTGIAETLMIHCRDQVLSITVSMGVAAYPNHGENADDILQAADAALYQAKEAGRNRVIAAA